jgi:hypothetical protein
MSRFTELDDLSPMPFGKHCGEPMEDVPVEYLHWLWQNGLKNEPEKSVNRYIRRNLDALKLENRYLIWD